MECHVWQVRACDHTFTTKKHDDGEDVQTQKIWRNKKKRKHGSSKLL
jgi:hypothetical protein